MIFEAGNFALESAHFALELVDFALEMVALSFALVASESVWVVLTLVAFEPVEVFLESARVDEELVVFRLKLRRSLRRRQPSDRLFRGFV